MKKETRGILNRLLLVFIVVLIVYLAATVAISLSLLYLGKWYTDVVFSWTDYLLWIPLSGVVSLVIMYFMIKGLMFMYWLIKSLISWVMTGTYEDY